MTDTPDEVDFEVDDEDFEPHSADPFELGPPSLIVDNLHVTYRVFGAKAAPLTKGKDSLGERIRRRTTGGLGGTTEVKAVKGVSFVARKGEAIGIVGTNGSGKSTLLKAAAGLIPPTIGQVYVSNEPSLLGVNAVLIRKLTGARNIMIGGLALGLSIKEVRERFDEIVEFAGLEEFINLPMTAYSSGMSARLRFAISSVARPDILMVDEALATGDATFRRKSQERIEEIREQAGTIFLVSHSAKTIQHMCTRALWIDRGRLRMDGDPDSVTGAYRDHIKSIRDSKSGK